MGNKSWNVLTINPNDDDDDEDDDGIGMLGADKHNEWGKQAGRGDCDRSRDLQQQQQKQQQRFAPGRIHSKL